MRSVLHLVVVAVLSSVVPQRAAAAENPASCHCFRDREYDPLHPAAADPYILATTRSSTLAAAFGADKATVVRIAMTGTSADDLWIAYWGAARTGKAAQALLEARRSAASWRAVLGAGGAAGAVQGAPKDASDAQLASAIVDEVVVSRLAASADVVHATRKAGAGSPELILSLLLAPRLGAGPPELVARVQAGKSWGALLAEAGIAPKDIDDVIAGRMKPSGQSWLLK